mmetsp:Transcript_7648/g.10852  ORF Transcript_7648/g.10852 Transcript_7648/m.10852 type:complete len:354 (-) Transcript_7648:217-1278(-)
MSAMSYWKDMEKKAKDTGKAMQQKASKVLNGGSDKEKTGGDWREKARTNKPPCFLPVSRYFRLAFPLALFLFLFLSHSLPLPPSTIPSRSSRASILSLPLSRLNKPPCFLPNEWTELTVKNVRQHNHDSKLFEIGLPEGKSLNLPICGCILAKFPGDDLLRPYTPVSTNDKKGSFELLIKIYPDGKFTQKLKDVKSGDKIEFKHNPEKNVKEQFPFKKSKVIMLAGGTGLTPMFQAIKTVCKSDEKTEITLIFGNTSEQDILLNDELLMLEEENENFKVIHTLTKPSEEWKGEKGFVDADKIKKYCPGPEEDPFVFVCGPPPMYKALCGPREEAKITGALGKLGYTEDQVRKF